MIELRCLGVRVARVDGGDPPPELLWRKNFALLVYLARSHGGSRARDHLVGLLWGEKPDAAARHSLNEALRILRRSAGQDAVTVAAGTITLDPATVTLDVDRLEQALGEGDLSAAAELATGEFLEGFGVPDASGFEDWLHAERMHWRGRSVTALVGAAEAMLAAGRPDLALDPAQRALHLEPGSDAACRATMLALALQGERGPALALFEAFRARLDDDVGIEPDAETAGLATRVRQERDWRVAERKPAEGAETRRPPLIGREAELAALLDLWTTVLRQSQPRLAMLRGAAGAGRSRLLEELVARCRLAGAATRVVRAVPGDAARPEGSPMSEAAVAIRRYPGSGGLVLAIDDAQWLDRDSLLGIETLLRDAAGSPQLVAMSVAEPPVRDEIDGLHARIGRELAGTVMTVGPLREPAMRELVRWALPRYDDEQANRLARRLMADTAGLPLLAVELLHALALGLELERGDVWPEPQHTMDQTRPGSLPGAITASIRMGFRRLPAAAREVVCAAAVLDEPVAADTLARATGIPDAELGEALDTLEWERWLAAQPRGFTFVARVAREVVARDMVTAGKRMRVIAAAAPTST